jgi:hypothetical protein
MHYEVLRDNQPLSGGLGELATPPLYYTCVRLDQGKGSKNSEQPIPSTPGRLAKVADSVT